MKAAAGLLLMLLGVSHAVETQCDGRKDGAQCYGALGGTLVLQLVDTASDIYKFQLKLNENVLLIVKENNILAKNGSIFTPSDGTFRINNLSRSDGAPVSSSRLVNDCLSQGELKVSCLSEGGDSPEYSWTLDGHTLTDGKLLSGNKKNNTIILNQDVSGLLACSVKNNVSHVSAEKQMSTCEEAGEQELTYADVRILQRQGKPVKQREEVEVEYGQVKFSEQPRQAVEPAGNDCVYAMVRKDR
ncbi:hypothetical protein INR49_024379 [Caranx melampygus]|nr:hypothetical protein INR49_024379 [Caranx melampygus]